MPQIGCPPGGERVYHSAVSRLPLRANVVRNIVIPPTLTNSTKIKAIVFDFGDVICFWDDQIWSDEELRLRGINGEELRNLMYEYMRHGGEGKYHSFLDYYDTHQHGSNIERKVIAGLYEDREQTGKLDPKMVNLITKLKSRYKIGLLSNYTKGLEDFLINRFKIHHLFDAVVSSYTIRIRKPAIDAYHYVAKELSEQVEHCLFVDDKQKNVDVALEAGMEAILFSGFDDLVKEMEQQFGISIS